MRKLGKRCVFLVFFFLFEIVDHGGSWGNTAQALAQWRHLVALHEAMDALHWVMRPALHHRIRMAFKIASV
jgi:hypothetical protein